VLICRMNALLGIGALQAWLMWNFLTFYLRHMREQSTAATQRQSAPRKAKQQDRSKARKKKEERKYIVVFKI
jgi:UDP-2,3-diacylglucosamine pyrophosphatase LpxH